MGPTINIEPINTGRKVKWRQRLARRKRYFFSWAKSWKLKEEILAINGYQFRIWLVLTTTPSVVWPTRTLTCFTIAAISIITCTLKWSNDIGTVSVGGAAVISCCTFVQMLKKFKTLRWLNIHSYHQIVCPFEGFSRPFLRLPDYSSVSFSFVNFKLHSLLLFLTVMPSVWTLLHQLIGLSYCILDLANGTWLGWEN